MSRHLIYIVLVLSLGKLFSCPKRACVGQPSVWRDFTSSPASVLYTLFFNLIPHRRCIHWFTFLNQSISCYIWLTCILIVYWMGDSCCPCSYLHPFIYCNITAPLSISFMLCSFSIILWQHEANTGVSNIQFFRTWFSICRQRMMCNYMFE